MHISKMKIDQIKVGHKYTISIPYELNDWSYGEKSFDQWDNDDSDVDPIMIQNHLAIVTEIKIWTHKSIYMVLYFPGLDITSALDIGTRWQDDFDIEPYRPYAQIWRESNA